jgi:hypothetical protein
MMARKDRPEVFFLRITPANWLLALLYSRSNTVYYWRSTLPMKLLGRFQRLAVESAISRDEWLTISDAAFDLWRSSIYPSFTARYTLDARYRGARIDFSLILIQHYSQEFERLFQLCRVLEIAKGGGAKVIEPWFARVLTVQELDAVRGGCEIVRSRANRLLEAPYEWIFVAGHLGRSALQALRRCTASGLEVRKGAVLWTGVAPQEIPTQDGRLDFAWASKYAGVPASRIVFFLPVEPQPAQRAYFERAGCVALGPTELGRLVTPARAVGAFIAAFAVALRALVSDRSATAPYRALFASRSFLWVDIAQALQPSAYVTTTSYCWPERPEVAALDALGVRTAIWSYSANALTFTYNAPDYRDLAVWRTAFVAQEFWAWNEAYRDWMLRRQIGTGKHRPRFRIAGPLMCGDASWLTKDRAAAKVALGLDPEAYYLAIFDVPRSGAGHRRAFYGGPRMFVDGYHEAFFQALLGLLHTYPRLRMFIKLKRPTSSQWHNFPSAQLELLDERNPFVREGRVVVVHQDTDPYLPIAACDAALGMPYTSPVLAALAQGKPGAYFDPLALARYPSEPDYKHVTIESVSDLERAAGEWLAGRGEPDRALTRRLLPIPETGFSVSGELAPGSSEAAGARLALTAASAT